MRRRRSLRIAVVIASVISAVFLLTTIFAFGLSTHRSPSLSWNASTVGYGLVQTICYRGQFHLTVDFAPSQAPAPRTWHAGAAYVPGMSFDLRMTDRFITKLGFDAFLIQGNTYFSVGV